MKFEVKGKYLLSKLWPAFKMLVDIISLLSFALQVAELLR